MKSQDIRYMIAFTLIILGAAFWFGAVSKLEFDGCISAGEFIARVIIGIVLFVVAVVVSGDMDELLEQISEQKKNRR